MFHLAQHAELVEIKRAWICPYTHRLLDKTLGEYSPYSTATSQAKAIEIEMPRLPWPFLRTATRDIDPQEVQHWLEYDPQVKAVRAAAVWPELSDRIVSRVRYFRVAEHSAQQTPAACTSQFLAARRASGPPRGVLGG